ncbi:phenylalanine--tRNA ligase subunit beta [Candidatus Curtissbacteria bacterium RIFCSPHIGHO2_01_FULL_41_44]|uniref:Phenylalanine--tRNA ligase beta subunit n=1 Tax=Candidatus Curtissbacteria bacterium RIFCSPLOWO2_01_FULL_42_50 TaxID=1797730 RepID=A0A1F5H7G5_9BACT|nr:MAG: phenylalanine--tRNA ligase subunit beta [Candidatus Curtissbacteria bacterium RIFCSPHIGHO2_01_FULL_41_44]OGD94247.1 MAG: phenylalanine--tRNA ligase subunit beta [Candidatus Curtissbacteria bacterium RIFCSPHIGHO2_02_FULL_42_58]OGD97721.1 MAG: phenylalanine--tRNA ligase subunit beta [Candidatus Curtissbacteria bacterium RIFCSPHIGHO2_12_FULL_42_33]OGE00114.1 MAG: phenylalanine--tRNA ligase subunit beta [Candidatus Curtissbacteria bacterium RIFCSPLOWO2_01_FULL_42_50]OGE02039.1 MAG: phenylal
MNIRVPVSWLREYLKTDLAAKTIANYLSASGPSVERIQKSATDYIFDIEVTGNRPDALSVFGIAREANAILTNENQNSQLVAPSGLKLELEPDISNPLNLEVIIKNHSLCPRFAAICLDNVKIAPSPAFIRNRLSASGIRAINNIVDITNYVMLELGQPMHTFDYDKIKKARMVLRESKDGEKIRTLDGKTRKLPKDTIVIEDENRLIDLCGIMGGQNSEISRRTKRVVLFVQAYDSTRVKKTAQLLAFRTEAAARFEKGVDLEGIIPALSRAVYLAQKTASAKIASELTDIVHAETKREIITLNMTKLNDYCGTEIPKDQAAKILGLLGFGTKITPQTIAATPPGWRANDVQNDVDLIEEIARIYGYWRLPAKLPSGQIPQGAESELAKVIELKKAIKYLGLTEIISYSIISEDFLKLTGVKMEDTVELANPLTSDWQFMRPTILVSLTDIIAKNQNLASEIKIFEVAKTYLSQENDLPKQDLMLGITLQNADFYGIKGLVENIFGVLQRDVKFEKLSNYSSELFDKSQSARVKTANTEVGTVGILNSKITDYFQIEGQIAACELNLSIIYGLSAIQRSYQPIPKYPPRVEDISAIFSKKVPVTDIISEVKRSNELVKKIEVVDIFLGQNLGEGKKSVTLRLTYQNQAGTPTATEVKQAKDKIIDVLSKSFAAIVRR